MRSRIFQQPVKLALALALAVGCAAGTAGAARAETDVGILGAVLAGTHVGSDNPTPVSGVVPGALLEATQRAKRVRLHLEGIPQVSAHAASPGVLGTSSASLSIVNATVLVDLDAHQRLRVGTGFQLVNLRNFNGNNGSTNQSRVASPIYAAGATLPLGGERFVDLNLMIDPNVRGILHVFDSSGAAAPQEVEDGAEVDYSAAYGVRRGRTTFLLGLRGLSYHTRDVATGQLVDRNVGGGVTFETRFVLGRR
jgi:hypothetical protein